MDPKIVDLLKKIEICAHELKIEAYVVGGIVRDELIKQFKLPDNLMTKAVKAVDIDLVVNIDMVSLLDLLKTKFNIDSGYNDKFLTAKILVDTLELPFKLAVDLVQMRKELYIRPGALPSVEAGTQLEDLNRRDFTINTLTLKLFDYIEYLQLSSININFLKSKLIDYLVGQKDLEDRVIRVIHDSSFVEDPTRLFRACRYAHLINGAFDERTEDHFNSAISGSVLNTISYDRKLQEVKKTFESDIAPNFFDSANVQKLFLNSFQLPDNSGKLFEFLKHLFAENINAHLESNISTFEIFKQLIFLLSKSTDPKFVGALQFNKKTLTILKKDQEKFSLNQVPESQGLNFFFHFLKN